MAGDAKLDGVRPSNDLSTGEGVDPGDAQLLASELAAAIVRWAQQTRASESVSATSAIDACVRQSVEALTLATAAGNVCLDLNRWAVRQHVDEKRWRDALIASGAVGGPEGLLDLPLVLDGAGRLYFARQFDDEQRLARQLLAVAAATPNVALPTGASPTFAAPVSTTPVSTPPVCAATRIPPPGALDRSIPQPDWQVVAIELALRQALTIISGGPGTGKTTTVVRILHRIVQADPTTRIGLAAPTGKAAARMMEAIRDNASAWTDAERALLPASATTVHRLIGWRPGQAQPARHAASPLPYDLLVIDEVSMLDLALATRLLEAIVPGTRLVLLGDRNQLEAVESGSVFAELATEPQWTAAMRDVLAQAADVEPEALGPIADPAKHNPLSIDHVVWLRHSFRFKGESAIGRLSAAVRDAQADTVVSILEGARAGESGRGQSRDGPELQWIPAQAGVAGLGPDDVACLIECHAHYRHVLAQPDATPAQIVEAFERARILCATRVGPRGTIAINAMLTRALRQPVQADGWYHGRPVQVLRNDPALGRSNGDVGIALRDPESGALQVWFAQAVRGSDGSALRAVAAYRLTQVETTWAMTVHKSQGSEFESVVVVMAEGQAHPPKRELLYTGITRAKKRLVLCASEETVRRAVLTRTERDSGLRDRLQESSGATG